MDFNTAKPQETFGLNPKGDLIPKGTIARVHLTLKRGGYDDPSRDWVGGYATHNPVSGAVYLNCEFTVVEGPYAKRKIWSLIGLYSPKGPIWNDIGRSFIRSILSSAHGFADKDDSPQAQEARKIKTFGELDGLVFVARIDGERDKGTGEERNVIKTALTKGHKDYPYESSQSGNTLPVDGLHPSAAPFWAR